MAMIPSIGWLSMRRLMTTTAAAGSRQAGTNVRPDASLVHHDYIGLPDKESNLRPILRHAAVNETALQRRLRHRRNEVENWNQEFWKNHNQRFFDEKKAFTLANAANEQDTLTADKMSEFYKAFLDKNWRLHFYYNVSWYTKNIELLFLATQVNISLVFKKLKRS